jgi:hypothetical protein
MCLSRKPHPALKYLQLERASAILLDRLAYPFFDGVLHIYGARLFLFLLIRSLIISRTALAAENLALRQQLAVLNRKFHRPHLHRRDRFFWVILSRLWKNWREVLIISCKADCCHRLFHRSDTDLPQLILFHNPAA